MRFAEAETRSYVVELALEQVGARAREREHPDVSEAMWVHGPEAAERVHVHPNPGEARPVRKDGVEALGQPIPRERPVEGAVDRAQRGVHFMSRDQLGRD